MIGITDVLKSTLLLALLLSITKSNTKKSVSTSRSVILRGTIRWHYSVCRTKECVTKKFIACGPEKTGGLVIENNNNNSANAIVRTCMSSERVTMVASELMVKW